jgi:hypothetical protein
VKGVVISAGFTLLGQNFIRSDVASVKTSYNSIRCASTRNPQSSEYLVVLEDNPYTWKVIVQSGTHLRCYLI